MNVLILAAAVLVALDQLTKTLAMARLHGRSPVSLGPVTIRAVVNRGYRGPLGGGVSLGVLWVAATATLAAAVHLGPFFQSPVAAAALGAALGGAGSNLFDRLWRRAVVDLVDLRVWPVFNLADLGIVLGGLTALLHM